MKRASYREAIEYIALNDEPCELDADAVQGYISVQLVCAIFHVPAERVARDVVRYRVKDAKGFTRHPEACTVCNGVGGHYAHCKYSEEYRHANTNVALTLRRQRLGY